MAQTTVQQLLKVLDTSVNSFVDGIPAIEQATFDKVLSLIKQLDLKGETIQSNVANVRLLSKIKVELDKIVLSNKYVESVREFVTAYGVVSRLNDRYFSAISKKYTPPKLLAEIRKLSIEETVTRLTESGIYENFTSKISNIIRDSITAGESYSELTEKLRSSIKGDKPGAGTLTKYARQVATDGINQYNRTYMKTVTDQLGFEWFRYTGSNLATSRPFCLAMTDDENEYFHISQVPDIIKGRLNSGNVSTEGMNKDTNETNFFIYAGGYNCGHSIIPVPEAIVPDRFKANIA